MDRQTDTNPLAGDLAAVRDHSRIWRENRYVYPVISRRSRGLSIGINLSPTKECSFRCVYCQVDRTTPPGEKVELATLIRELHAMLALVAEGELWSDPRFAATPREFRRLRDIAMSGDGEPTACRGFADIVQVAADARAFHKLKDTKIVVISNATRFHTQRFRNAVPILQGSNGEVWAKLDAGSPGHFARCNRTAVPFKKVLANIEWLAGQMPVVIQTCLFRMDGEDPSDVEIELYAARLRHILDTGGHLKSVQLYTIARPPAEGNVTALPDGNLGAIAAKVRDSLEGVRVDLFTGTDAR